MRIAAVAGFWRVGKGDLKAWLARNRQPSHRQPVLEARDGTLGLERLHTDWRKQHRIQRESGTRGARNGQMADMRRIETATKEGYARSPSGQLFRTGPSRKRAGTTS